MSVLLDALQRRADPDGGVTDYAYLYSAEEPVRDSRRGDLVDIPLPIDPPKPTQDILMRPLAGSSSPRRWVVLGVSLTAGVGLAAGAWWAWQRVVQPAGGVVAPPVAVAPAVSTPSSPSLPVHSPPAAAVPSPYPPPEPVASSVVSPPPAAAPSPASLPLPAPAAVPVPQPAPPPSPAGVSPTVAPAPVAAPAFAAAPVPPPVPAPSPAPVPTTAVTASAASSWPASAGAAVASNPPAPVAPRGAAPAVSPPPRAARSVAPSTSASARAKSTAAPAEVDESPAPVNLAADLEDAWARLERGEWAEAEAIYRRVLASRRQPEPDAALGLAVALHRQKRWTEAWDAYRASLRVWPDNPVAPTAMLSILTHTDAATAQSRLKSWVAERPQDAAAASAYGLLLGRKGQWTEAVSPLRRARELQPANGAHAYNLAVALDQLGRFADAADQYRTAVSLGGVGVPVDAAKARLTQLISEAQP